ncbi:MAG: LysR family transcriptional regulator [Alphaproteobacteria bacterium]|nr:LysR family transcriptional regulator [Alphaproteobacteria bacterium]
MEISHLRYFQAVARAGSFSAAARELGISQPSVSNAIKTLEQRLGTRLLQRARDGVTLTETGQSLLMSADDILERVDEAARRITALENEEEGRFVLGCYESLGAYFLPAFLGDFLREHPRIHLQLWNGSSSAVRQAVIDRVVDVGLVVNTLPHPDLVIVPAFEDRIEIVDTLPPADDLDEARERLVGRPLIHADRPVFAQIVERLAARAMLGEDLLVCGDLELVKSLALGGVGAAILPRRVARYGHAGTLRPVHPELPSFADTIHVVWRADLPRTRAWRVLKEALLASAGRMGPPDCP